MIKNILMSVLIVFAVSACSLHAQGVKVEKDDKAYFLDEIKVGVGKARSAPAETQEPGNPAGGSSNNKTLAAPQGGALKGPKPKTQNLTPVP